MTPDFDLDFQTEAALAVQPVSRALTLLYILICLELGVLLFLVPWVSWWSRNFFVSHYLWVSRLAGNYFIRGAVSGVGVADIGLAFSELWRFRARLKPGNSRPLR